jgi:hypothetical protein
VDLEALINAIGQLNGWILLAALSAPPILAWVLGRCHGPYHGESAPWAYLYSALIYLVCVPGLFGGVLTGYTLFFIRRNLLQVNLFVYFGPVASMLATLLVIRKQVDWNRLPGIDRIQALMVLIALSFIIALALYKARVWLFFGGSIANLMVIAVVCFALLKWAANKLMGPGPRASTAGGPPPVHPTRARNDLKRIKKRLKR